MRQHKKSERVQSEACGALANLAYTGTCARAGSQRCNARFLTFGTPPPRRAWRVRDSGEPGPAHAKAARGTRGRPVSDAGLPAQRDRAAERVHSPAQPRQQRYAGKQAFRASCRAWRARPFICAGSGPVGMIYRREPNHARGRALPGPHCRDGRDACAPGVGDRAGAGLPRPEQPRQQRSVRQHAVGDAQSRALIRQSGLGRGTGLGTEANKRVLLEPPSDVADLLRAALKAHSGTGVDRAAKTTFATLGLDGASVPAPAAAAAAPTPPPTTTANSATAAGLAPGVAAILTKIQSKAETDVLEGLEELRAMAQSRTSAPAPSPCPLWASLTGCEKRGRVRARSQWTRSGSCSSRPTWCRTCALWRCGGSRRTSASSKRHASRSACLPWTVRPASCPSPFPRRLCG